MVVGEKTKYYFKDFPLQKKETSLRYNVYKLNYLIRYYKTLRIVYVTKIVFKIMETHIFLTLLKKLL